MMLHYILDAEHNAVAVEDVLTWARWFEHSEHRIVRQEPVGPWFVSTVFLGLDHGWGNGPPLIFESMVFKRDAKSGKLDGASYWMQRYATWDEAEAGHAHMTAYLAACGRPPGEEEHP